MGNTLRAYVSTSTIGQRFRAEIMTLALIQTERLHLHALDLSDLDDIREYYVRNAIHLQPWEPARSETFHTPESWRARIETSRSEFSEGRALKLIIRSVETDAMLGVCNFTNIVRGPFQACTLGYSIAESAEGKGLMHEALKAALDFMFKTRGLHRIMANYVPENERSARLLDRLGFEIEGHAKDYLHIAGRWRDHVLTAKINPGIEA